ncbi:hypothetical protein [Alteromonas antoniana]|uniref:hypothetical protein n=1 Tax=Alteromonas antoniana TaxID=2803813 RepID=UPI001C47D290|nr:hypothetical protein [Alteromonas antoniana]
MGKKNTVGESPERRQIPRTKDGFYRAVLVANALAWLILIIALILFHFARPDFVSGVQQYWGVEGDTQWSQRYVDAMTAMLQICLGVSLLTMIMRARRNRRRDDNYGVNLFILAGISLVSLLTLTIKIT